MTSATIRRTLMTCALALGLAVFSVPAAAQTGQIKGKVVDAQGSPVDGAKIVLYNTQTNRSLETKSNKKGEYIQVGLSPGKYKVTASKDALSQAQDIDIHLDMANLDFKLTSGGGGGGAGVSKEEAAKAKAKAELATKTFADGVTLSGENKHDEAIAKFQEVLTMMPTCPECYAAIGSVQTNAKKYDEAEASFKKALEQKADYAEAYNGLANLYNSQKKFDLAAEASKKAMEIGGAGAAGGAGASASSVFNQGVILWNANKYAEAKAQFEQAVKLDPNMADAQYWLGMAFLNSGDTAGAKPKFEAYLKLAPTGQYAETAKSIVASIK